MSSEDHREESAEQVAEASVDTAAPSNEGHGAGAGAETEQARSEPAGEVTSPQAPQDGPSGSLSALNKAVLIALVLLGAIWLFQALSGESEVSVVDSSTAPSAPVQIAPEGESANVAVLDRGEDTDVVTLGGIERRGEGRHFFTSIKVPAGAESLYLSGSGASPLEDGSWGDMEQQVTDTFESFKQTLESQGWSMGDIIQVRAFALSDEFGYLDFDGFNRGYRKFFGTEENPLKPVRTFVEIQDLVVPGWLVEIEIRAARVK